MYIQKSGENMKIGLQIPNYTYPEGSKDLGNKLAEIARTAEEAGFSSIWVMDHFFQIGSRDRAMGLGPAEEDMLEGYSTLSYLAAITKKVNLGTMVTGAVYRHPGILVKTVTTLDVLSGGRAYFGIGAGWFEREARGLGVPYPSTKERFERLEEACKSLNKCGRPRTALTTANIINSPKLCACHSLSRSHIHRS